MPANESEIKDAVAENERLKVELGKALAREKDYHDARRAMLFMLEDLNKTAEEVSKAQRQWVATFDSITDPIFIHDRDFRIVRVNRAYMESSGKTYAEIIGKPYYEVFPRMEGPFPLCARAREAGFEEIEAVEEESEITAPSLNKVFKLRYYPVHDREGKYIYSVHILEDITVAKKIENRLREEVGVTTSLLKMAEATAKIKDMDTLLLEVSRSSSMIVRADACLSYLRDPERKAFYAGQSYGLSRTEEPFFRTSLIAEDYPRLKEAFDKGSFSIEHAIGVEAEGGEGASPLKWTEGASTLLFISLSGAAGPAGLLVAVYRRRKDFTETEKRVIRGIQHQASTALEEARLYRESVDRAMELSYRMETIQVMHEIDRSILSTLEPDAILETSVKLISRLMPCERATVTAVDNERGGFVFSAGFGVSFAKKGFFVPFEETLATQVVRTGRPQVVTDLDDIPDLPPLEQRLLADGFRSHIRVPLSVKGNIIALLNVGAKRPGVFRPEDLSALEKLASQISVALENSRLITDLKQTAFELKKLTMALEKSVNIVFITGSDGKVEYVNPIFEEISGYQKDEARGQDARAVFFSGLTDSRYGELLLALSSGRTWRGETKNAKKTGGHYWCSTNISPVRDETGKVTHFLAVSEDITEKKRTAERIRYLAEYDELTGLLNRTRFAEVLKGWITEAKGGEGGEAGGALFMMDIDQFKFINETYGHTKGDEFLKGIAKALKSAVERIPCSIKGEGQDAPIIGRISADEFAFFLPHCSRETGVKAAEELRRAVSDFRYPGIEASFMASIGAALFPEHGTDADLLMSKADAAMFRAKELGRDRCHIYRPEDKDLELMHERMSGRERIINALKEGRFVPWFQPILKVSDGTVANYEVLARMKDENGNIFLPGSFIDTAERFGLISSIDRMIMEKAIAIQAQKRKEGFPVSFDINLSGKDLGEEGLLTFINDRIRESGADPGGLVFEITETAAIADLGRAVNFIKSLKSLGCRFALDDFGVGFTSFTYLKEMRVDYIKIDGSFIRKLHASPDDQLFVKAIADVAKGLRISSVAEFVENKETFLLLKEYGVDYAQGYFIGKPAPTLDYERGLFYQKA